MKIALALLTVFGFLQTALCQEGKKNPTNSTDTVSTLAMFRKAPLLGPSPKLSFDASALLSESPIIVVFPKIDTNRLFTLKPFQWDAPLLDITDEKPKGGKEVRYAIIEGTKDSMPDLYYLHSDQSIGSDEQSDTFGKVWLLPPQTSEKCKLIFPLIEWNIPSAIGERVTFGFGFAWEFP